MVTFRWLSCRHSPHFLLRKGLFVITGFNTDIEHEGVTYHVQTEDNGRSKPIILSLVYNGGTILASKRSRYDDLLVSNFNESTLAERLSKQHRLICAAVQAGRIEDLKKMTARDAAQASPSGGPRLVRTPVAEPRPAAAAFVQHEIAAPADPQPIKPKDLRAMETPIPKPASRAAFEGSEAYETDVPIIEAVAIIEDDGAFENDIIIPAEAVSIVEEPQAGARPAHGKLGIDILGDVRFKGGNRNNVAFLVSRGSQKKVVAGAQIMVKILGSSFRPVIFHALTDQNGVASVNVQLPNFTSGRAAFLVRAIADGEEIELRRSVAHG